MTKDVAGEGAKRSRLLTNQLLHQLSSASVHSDRKLGVKDDDKTSSTQVTGILTRCLERQTWIHNREIIIGHRPIIVGQHTARPTFFIPQTPITIQATTKNVSRQVQMLIKKFCYRSDGIVRSVCGRHC